MKNIYLLALSAIMLVPGCGKDKKKPVKKDEKNREVAMNLPLSEAGDSKGNFFDDQIDAFVLEEHGDWDTEDGMSVARNEEPVLSWVAQEDQANKDFRAVYFDFDRHGIREDQEISVYNNVGRARQVAQLGDSIVVEGHACHAAGSKTYNLLISEQRAQEVARRLELDGVQASSLKVVGRGTEMPVVLGGDKNEQAANRRVEMFTISA